MRHSGHMDELDRLSGLIGGIYDAALDHEKWPGVLRQTANFIGGYSAAIFAKEITRHKGFVAYESGEIGEANSNSYFEYYVKYDPSFMAQFFAEIGEPISTTDMVPYEEFVQSRFYLEWAKPQGLVDFVASVLDKNLTSAAMFGVFRHERDGVVDEEARRRMRLVVPHIRRSVLIGRLIDLKTAETETFAGAIDSLSAGMFLVDASGRIVHANASGLALLAAGAPLRALNGRFGASDALADKHLHEIFAAAGEGDGAVGTKGIAIALTHPGGGHHVAHIMPLTAGARSQTGAAYRAVAAVFVREAALDMVFPPELIAKAFRLTPTELRILLAIVEVGGVPEVAVALGIAESTVKTHLGSLFEKTESKRQADLVKIFARYATPH